MQSNSVVVLLLLTAANCIARNVRNELNWKERLNSLIGRHQTNNGTCERILSLFRNYGSDIEGGVIDTKSLLGGCDIGYTYFMNVNPSSFNSTTHIICCMIFLLHIV